MTKDFSFGIIPIKFQKKQLEYLLIHHQKEHWAFPKGHAEDGEGALEAAVRELREETNLQADIVSQTETFKEEYTFTTPEGAEIFKTNTFFIGLIHDSDVIIQPAEVQDYAWLSYEKALEKITFPADQKLLTEVHQYLQQNPAYA